jgi:hypothetical protein
MKGFSTNLLAEKEQKVCSRDRVDTHKKTPINLTILSSFFLIIFTLVCQSQFVLYIFVEQKLFYPRTHS